MGPRGAASGVHSAPVASPEPYQESGISRSGRSRYAVSMGPGDAAERIRREIVRLSHEGHDSRTLRSEALRRLRAAVPFEASFFATADPATLLYTGAVREGISPTATPRFVENELLQDDVNKFAHL